MLLNLSIRDFVLVDRLDLEFAEGFSVLTGETGAGKSILLDALQLVLGGRAEAGVVRAGRERAEIAALFAPPAGLTVWLAAAGLDGDETGCLLRRTVEAGGRSRAYVNGRPVTLGQLKEAGEFLVDIYGQHSHYSLLRPGVQRQLLDEYASATDLAGQVVAAYRAWQTAERAAGEAEGHAAAVASERTALEWQVEELARLDFRVEDWHELQDRHRRLAHAAELMQGAQAVVDLLESEQGGALAGLNGARARLAALATIDPALDALLAMLDDALAAAHETGRDLNRYAEQLDLDPAALADAEVRLAQVTDAARKFHVRPEHLPELLAEARARLAEVDRLTDVAGLRRSAEAAGTEYRRLAGRLSETRAEAAGRLAKAVTEVMQRLSMHGGRFEVALEACAPEAGGLESVDYLAAPHPGQPPRPIARTASGGELSRIGLALRAVLSGQTGAPTLIFDEVDAGIGGGVAEVVGRMLADLGRRHQVLCVTHLPQVAATAQHHWRVSKTQTNAEVASRVEALSGTARTEEIARMLGGVRMTEATLRHAAEMLGGADPGAPD